MDRVACKVDLACSPGQALSHREYASGLAPRTQAGVRSRSTSSTSGHRPLCYGIILPRALRPKTQKGTGIAASPHVTGLRLPDPEESRGLVSAACSTRAGKGMRASRRSPRPADATARGQTSFPAFSGPLPICPGGTNLKPCGIRFPDFLPPPHRLRHANASKNSIGRVCCFDVACAPSPLSSQPGFSIASRFRRCACAQPCPRWHRRPCIPRTVRLWFPEGTCVCSIRCKFLILLWFPAA